TLRRSRRHWASLARQLRSPVALASLFVLGVAVMAALVPGLPFFPFMVLGGIMAFGSWVIPRRIAEENRVKREQEAQEVQATRDQEKDSVKSMLKTAEIELLLGKQVSTRLLGAHQELAFRVGKMRKKFAAQYGFVVPEIKVSDDITIPDKSYQIRIHGTTVASNIVRVGEVLVVTGGGRKPSVPGDDIREPAFGMPAVSILETFAEDLRREGFHPIHNVSVVLTHLSEVIRNNLPQLLSYKDVKVLIERLDPEYRKLADEICSSHMSYSGLQAVLKLLLAERVSIRNLHLILEAVAELAPHVRKTEQIIEHVRIRMAQQICGDLTDNGILPVLRLGNKWDMVFHQALKRDSKGEIVEFDIDPRQLEEFSEQATRVIREFLDRGTPFVLVTSPESRSYVRMIIERLFATLPVLSHVELAKGIEIKSIDPEKRKDPAARKALMAETDVVILCLPDDAAKEAVALADELGGKSPRIIDAPTAHRVAPGWTYGFPELTKGHAEVVAAAKRVTNPGCYPTGAIALLRPLV
ncbi:MAG: FHIPEP family type III secretion protein, partial [Rhizobiales bacterium]|nr:FHIPEP family type III secretion protein [Hyphomicrobiales bacterium]